MKNRPSSDHYDAIIIGAGIGGLVCGCYLAKAGMKVLICEQHHKPGGYCTSFRRGKFTFDAAAHSFGGYREGDRIYKIITDLGIARKIAIAKSDPTDIIISPDHKVTFFSDPRNTMEQLAVQFPTEQHSLKSFFRFVNSMNPSVFVRLRKLSFSQLLDSYFSDRALKSVISFPIMGNSGIPPSQLSAVVGAQIFYYNLLDGGYRPQGGMQTFSNAFSASFVEYGGTLACSCPVRRILLQGSTAIGVTLENGESILAPHVIAACDMKHVFSDLLTEDADHTHLSLSSAEAIPSPSMFLLYIGLDDTCRSFPLSGVNYWVMPHYDIENIFASFFSSDISNLDRFLLQTQLDGRSVVASINMGFRDKDYWDNNRQRIAAALLDAVDARLIPGIKQHIAHLETATPLTLRRFTINYEGAAYGWAGTPSQFCDPAFRRPGHPQNLIFTGHWASQGAGIPSVMYLGSDTAQHILRTSRRSNGAYCHG